MNRLRRIILVLLCFEIGVVLVVVPWTGFWERNFFLDRFPDLRAILLNHYLRGAITGLGLLDIWVAGTWVRPRRTKKAVA
jgi:hypothetical protein